uniref:Photosystem I reaction center subunit VIII n=1 Tax=Hildenbrandia rivularis TaxID=135206 RepID=A0A1C9CFJ3_9FLOR|nr:photosystem I subunit VIII [Hildenbrandia rivularis]AOM67132.1 photosystem I subunit VIII [Hildenbrandia rivularis]
MITPYLPSVLVPLIGIIFPAIGMTLLFIYIEQDSVI